jgi:two-component system, NarL family, sensor histidine kinase DesK
VDVNANARPPASYGVRRDASRRRWTVGWRLMASRAVALVYLVYVVGSIRQNAHGAAAVLAYVGLAVFAVGWLVIVHVTFGPPARFWTLYGILVALMVLELPAAHAAGFVLGVFIAISTVARLGARSFPIVAVLALASLLVPPAIPAWQTSLSTAFGDVTPLAIPVVALAVYAIMRVLESNNALAEARAELAALAAENERFRIARDLHDLLGHSLTTITVKAGLAARLGEDPARQERARQEIAEVETLARQALGDMRAAVANYRDVSLAGELATGRQLLRAAGIAADLPRAVDMVDPAHQELFGWVVREGLTNIVRHAHASSCAVRLTASGVEITDDGVGGTAPPSGARPGNGLPGLRERVAAAGGVVDAGPLEPKGWRLRVRLAPAGEAG